jgi:anti-sigma B factor antagonist
MSQYRRLDVTQIGSVTVVHFLDGELRGEANIEEMGQELVALVEKAGHTQIVVNFSTVEYLSSAALVKLIALHNLLKRRGGKLKLCHIRPEFYEVFAITKLNSLFDIVTTEAEALSSFGHVRAG